MLGGVSRICANDLVMMLISKVLLLSIQRVPRMVCIRPIAIVVIRLGGKKLTAGLTKRRFDRIDLYFLNECLKQILFIINRCFMKYEYCSLIFIQLEHF